MSHPPTTPTALLVTALLTALLPSCAVDETVSPVPGSGDTSTTTTTESTTESTGTGGSGGAPSAPIRTVEQRSPFGNVAASDNLLWDGDFEWSSPFSDQYGWLFGPPYGYDFPAATIGAACRSGVKCVTLAKGKAIIGIGVSSRTEALSITAFAKPQQGGCAGVLVSLLDIDTSHKDVDVPATTEDPDSVGWCLYRVETPAYEKKVYLLIDNNTGDDLVVDDAVVRVLPTKSAPPPPPPMGPMEGARLLRHEEAKAAILAHRLPVLPPKDKDPVKRAFEEHLSR